MQCRSLALPLLQREPCRGVVFLPLRPGEEEVAEADHNSSALLPVGLNGFTAAQVLKQTLGYGILTFDKVVFFPYLLI